MSDVAADEWRNLFEVIAGAGLLVFLFLIFIGVVVFGVLSVRAELKRGKRRG